MDQTCLVRTFLEGSMTIVAYIAIGVCCFVALMLCVLFIIGCNGYDGRIQELENWKRRAESTISAWEKIK
jgi:hypothetical protein